MRGGRERCGDMGKSWGGVGKSGKRCGKVCWGVGEVWESVLGGSIGSDGHDKPFCTKAITIVDNFKKTLSDTDNR